MELLKIKKGHTTSHNILQNQLHDQLLALYAMLSNNPLHIHPSKRTPSGLCIQ